MEPKTKKIGKLAPQLIWGRRSGKRTWGDEGRTAAPAERPETTAFAAVAERLTQTLEDRGQAELAGGKRSWSARLGGRPGSRPSARTVLPRTVRIHPCYRNLFSFYVKAFFLSFFKNFLL